MSSAITEPIRFSRHIASVGQTGADRGALDLAIAHGHTQKPSLVVQLDHGVTANVVAPVLEWVRQSEIMTLNVAGPRESKLPGIYRLTRELLDQIDAANQSEVHQPYGSRYPGANTAFCTP